VIAVLVAVDAADEATDDDNNKEVLNKINGITTNFKIKTW
jgi:hypothetical protein